MKQSSSSTDPVPQGFAAHSRGVAPMLVLLTFVVLCPAELAAKQTDGAPGAIPFEVASGTTETEIGAARADVAANPNSEADIAKLVAALARAGRKREALAELERFAAGRQISASFRAQRAFLRRELNDLPGATADFTAALAGEGLTADQRRNVDAGLEEVRTALSQDEFKRAEGYLTQGNFDAASDAAQLILGSNPKSEPAMLIRIDALARAGRKREAMQDADLFAQRMPSSALIHARRGFLRRELNDPRGAADDFAVALASGGLTVEQRQNIEAGLREARQVQAQGSLAALTHQIETLSLAGRKGDALAAADRVIAANPEAGVLRARRGYLRRELGQMPGAIADFSASLASNELAAEQRRSVQAALVEARAAEQQSSYRRAQAALDKGDFRAATGIAEGILMREPNSEAAQKIRIDALSRAGRKADARAATDRLIARGQGAGWAYAERGFARREAGDLKGAIADFDAALARNDLNRASIPDIRYARAEAIAMQADGAGDPLKAEASYRELLAAEPAQADGWFKLGYLLLAQKQRHQGAEALSKGLELRPVATAYLDSANAYILTNAPLASKNYREGLDRWYAGDKSLSQRSEVELERVKNEVVEADASVRTNVSFGGISGRPVGAGGTNSAGGVDTRVRFDGRYLPSLAGLEAFARGLSDKDSTGERETRAGAGLRYRPLANLNLYFGGMIDHSFQPQSETEFVALWGLGLGADAYPYTAGRKAYWDFGTFGSWRTSEQRLLQDTRANIGFMQEVRAPVRAAIGPTLLAVASYDSLAATPWAAGIGPSLLSYVWLGGDRYRSYDTMLTLQVGYLFNVGPDQRQRGWRGQIGVTF